MKIEATIRFEYSIDDSEVAGFKSKVLQYIKDNGVTPKWVQVGNETSNGFLWSVKRDERVQPV